MKVLISDEKLKITFIILLLVVSCLLTYYFQIILHITIIYSHFFYIPIVLSSLWWKKRGLIVSVFLVGIIIFLPLVFEENALIRLDNIIRGIFIILIAILLSILSIHISKSNELTKAYNKLEFYKFLFMHDVNNLFQNVLSAADLYSVYQKNESKKEELDHLLDIIRMQAIRGGLLVSNTLKLYEIENTEVPLEKIEVLTVLREAVSFTYKSCQSKAIDIEIDSEYEKLFILANNLLLDIFENILFNAVKYNNSNIVKISVKLSKTQEDHTDYIKLEFLDNGIGISDDLKKNIFNQGFTGQKHSKGMGIGLSLVKKIIQNYNGKISVENRVLGDYKEGSNFIVEIPEIN
ncbi:MAG: HAMP domain-containing histidine kinase [Promethearchaeota archaeon]|nr:MAG: HAMP domain-containing histidine kinase [Candidatus Lokiarchaeota archaeon]